MQAATQLFTLFNFIKNELFMKYTYTLSESWLIES